LQPPLTAPRLTVEALNDATKKLLLLHDSMPPGFATQETLNSSCDRPNRSLPLLFPTDCCRRACVPLGDVAKLVGMLRDFMNRCDQLLYL
jgi:hypothetical protein